MKGKYAAIMPMWFTQDGGGTRTEDFIAFADGNWEHLPALLEAPVEWLRAQQFEWIQDAKKSVAFQLLTPLNATIECGYADIQNLQTATYLLQTQVSQALTKSPNQENFQRSLDSNSLFEGSNLTNIINFFKGSFIVLFNTYTTNIRVLYFPPDTSKTLKKFGDKGRYQTSFASPSLYSIGGLDGRGLSVLHYDLVDSSARQRAEFLTALMEYPPGIMDLIASSRPITRRNFEMKPAGEKLLPPLQQAVPQPPVPEGYSFSTSPCPQTNVKNASSSALDKYREYPRIQVNGLSQLAVCNNCEVALATLVKTVYHLGPILSENYDRVLYDPTAVIKQVVRGMEL